MFALLIRYFSAGILSKYVLRSLTITLIIALCWYSKYRLVLIQPLLGKKNNVSLFRKKIHENSEKY